MLDVTVCILSYNRPIFLRETLLSVLAQTRLPEKIVIYDNGSDSSVYNNIKNLLGERVQWVGADVNYYALWNFRRAMHNTESQYVMMLHDDDRLCANFLESQIAFLDANLSLAAVSCNGYFIDEVGKRTGGTLAPISVNNLFELYECSGQVAIKYAGNSCIPFSPTIYRTDIAKKIDFREDFGKVIDAVYFCDLAEIASIGYQTAPMYESRLHSGQDSSYFPYDLMNQLEEFFISRTCTHDVEKSRLQQLLIKQHTARNIKQCLQLIKQMDFFKAISLLIDSKFKWVAAVQLISAGIVKYTLRKY
jgi:glycosyltransferase involved in cell wall biosynthesis